MIYLIAGFVVQNWECWFEAKNEERSPIDLNVRIRCKVWLVRGLD